MNELTAAQRQYVRRLAHDLPALVHIGQKGLTEQVLTNIDQALTANELIKVKCVAERDERPTMAATIANQTRSHLIGLIGNILILYRQQADPEERKIELPR
ncbi:MAG: YhbY family RNA-binding protein [Herpetosiphonaceae bacterium]|nr:YhbY family RNA-binding protein [Herpetosiphonaceae bacterium]